MGFLSGIVGSLFGGGEKAPAVPNAVETANAQAAANLAAAKQQAELNRTNATTPFGSSIWSNSGDTWSNTQTLSPELQSIYDSLLGHAKTGLADTVDTSGMQDWKTLSDVTGTDSLEDYQKSISDSLYNQSVSRLDPRFNFASNDLDSRLAAQGITQGSEAYNREKQLFGNERTDAYQQALYDSLQGGVAAGQTYQNMALADVNQNNLLRQAQFSEANTARQQIMNELMGFQSGTQMADTGADVNVAAAPIAQSTYNSYNGQLGQYNANTQSSNQAMGMLGQIASTPAVSKGITDLASKGLAGLAGFFGF